MAENMRLLGHRPLNELAMIGRWLKAGMWEKKEEYCGCMQRWWQSLEAPDNIGMFSFYCLSNFDSLEEGRKTLKGSTWQKAVLSTWCCYAVWSMFWLNAGFWLTSSGEFLLPCLSIFVTVLWLQLGDEFIFKVYHNTLVAILLNKTHLRAKKNHCNYSKSTSFVLLQRFLHYVTQNFNNTIIWVLNVGVYNSPCLIPCCLYEGDPKNLEAGQVPSKGL